MVETYVLDDDGNPVAEPDPLVICKARRDASMRVVAKTTVGESAVSTVFLFIDHNPFPDKPPELFETLVFGGKLADEMDRYATRAQALEGHAAMVDRVTAAEVPTS